MMQIIRGLVVIVGLFFLLLGVLFMWEMPPFPGPWLNTYLVGATLTAFAISTFWIAATQTYKAFVGGGLCMITAFGGAGIYLLRLSLQMTGVMQAGEFCLYIAILALWFLFLGLKVPKRKIDRLPLTTQWLFALTLTVALLNGIYLTVPLPGHFPWLLNPELSVLYGWILIGSSLFFGWSLIQPIWENGYPLLYALLAYDALLIGPLLNLLQEPTQVAVVPVYLWFAIIFISLTGVWALLELMGRFFIVRKS
ncbi:MAG: hypothetical protein JJU12_01925 [Chlamydiales bacterium]|nr:hypothetical protein [Chlamydiales bacterium]